MSKSIMPPDEPAYDCSEEDVPHFVTPARPLKVPAELLALDANAFITYEHRIGTECGNGRCRAGSYVANLRSIIARQRQGFFTVDEAAQILADGSSRKSGVAWVDEFRDAVEQGCLSVRDPESRVKKRKAEPWRPFSYLVSAADVDAWLSEQGVGYGFPKVPAKKPQPPAPSVAAIKAVHSDVELYYLEASEEFWDFCRKENFRPAALDLVDGNYAGDVVGKLRRLPRFKDQPRPTEIPAELLSLPQGAEVILQGEHYDRVLSARYVIQSMREKMQRQALGRFEIDEAAQILADATGGRAGGFYEDMKRAFLAGKLTLRVDDNGRDTAVVPPAPLAPDASEAEWFAENLNWCFERVVTPRDINDWLERDGASCRFPEVKTFVGAAEEVPEEQIEYSSGRTVAHHLERRKDPLRDVFKQALGMGASWENHHSMFNAVVQLAKSKNPPYPLIEYIDGEGVKWQKYVGGVESIEILTLENVYDRCRNRTKGSRRKRQ